MTPIILALSLIAAQVVEFDMDQKQQKATGVTKLSKKEKRSLKEWIDHHYAKRVPSRKAGLPLLRSLLLPILRGTTPISSRILSPAQAYAPAESQLFPRQHLLRPSPKPGQLFLQNNTIEVPYGSSIY
jgi:hypothetical protein